MSGVALRGVKAADAKGRRKQRGEVDPHEGERRESPSDRRDR
jgi:hypothetical protein